MKLPADWDERAARADARLAQLRKAASYRAVVARARSSCAKPDEAIGYVNFHELPGLP